MLTNGAPALTYSTLEVMRTDARFRNFNSNHNLWDLLTTARFFMIRSNCRENLAISIQHSEWATTFSNQRKLEKAYKMVPNIILIFSANKTNYFQGFGRMSTNVSDKISQHWMSNDSFNSKLGGCFGVDWKRLCDLHYSETEHLRNSLAEDSTGSVKFCRDCSELSQDCGI